MRFLLALLWAGCAAPTAPRLEVSAAEGGADVVGATGEIRLLDGAGGLVSVHEAHPSGRTWIPLPPGRGSLRVESGGAAFELVEPTLPADIAIEAPAGQARVPVVEGARVDAVAIGEEPLRAVVVVTARAPTDVDLSWGDQRATARLDAVGQRLRLPLIVADDTEVHLDLSGTSVDFVVDVSRWTTADAGQKLAVEAVTLPTDAAGVIDRARPPDRVSLPSAWWTAALQAAGIGFRARDDQAPWTWQTVRVRNDGDEPVNLLVRAFVLDAVGAPAAAFAPRLREARSDAVQVLVRVPARASVDAALPLFVDRGLLLEPAAFVRRIDLVPLGSEVAVASVSRPLHVSVGSSWASGWMVGALLTSVAGWAWLVFGARRWIARSRTEDLVTIALFGSVTWVAGTALQVAGLGVAAVLGPFAPLVTGVADDALRACLLGTLIVLAPRPGTAAVATAVGFGMRGLTLGSFHPVDLLYLGSAACWLELWLWVSGCTRGAAWRDAPVEVFARLSIGLGAANVCATATALVVSVVAYRLYFADWYVGLILALPGFAYVVLGCALAVGFSGALRRVAS